MSRISREQMWMDMAEVASRRATCSRASVGALVVRDNDILSQGYNGPPSGEAHCLGNSCPLINGGCSRSIHAERNAVERALNKLGTDLNMCTLFSTHGPCPECASSILQAKISKVFYRYSYRLQKLELLIDGGVEVFRITPSGSVINEKTGEITPCT